MVQNVLSWGLERSQILHVMCHLPIVRKRGLNFHCVHGVLMIDEFEGSLPWRFSTVNLEEVPMEIEHAV